MLSFLVFNFFNFFYINSSAQNIMVAVPLAYCLIVSTLVFRYYANFENLLKQILLSIPDGKHVKGHITFKLQNVSRCSTFLNLWICHNIVVYARERKTIKEYLHIQLVFCFSTFLSYLHILKN